MLIYMFNKHCLYSLLTTHKFDFSHIHSKIVASSIILPLTEPTKKKS